MGDKYIVFIDKDTNKIVPVKIASNYISTIRDFLDKFINSSSIISFENKDNSYIHSASSNKNDIIEKILNYSFNTRSKNICCIVISNNIVIYNINDNSGVHRINNSLYNNKIKSLIKTVEKYIEIKYKSKKQQTSTPMSTFIFPTTKTPLLQQQQMQQQQMQQQQMQQMQQSIIDGATHVIVKSLKK
jgi:hypothetical protein